MDKKAIKEAKKISYSKETDSKESGEIFNNLIWMTTEDAARYLRKTADAIRHLVYRGDLKARKFKRRLYFRRDELDEMLDLAVY
ncbi:MAG: helix-turn-helix domain-containing protein [Bacteriovoracaceae bacterium]|nr:helix-turn-helix domain-containing protein [Bacteriovoracaceae bacterium]